MSGVEGIEGFDVLIKGFNRVAESGMKLVSQSLAEEQVDLIKEGFKNGTAPDGSAWAALSELSRNGDGGTPLNDTGQHLKNATHIAAVSPSSYRVVIGFQHASVHQRGAVIVAKGARALCWPCIHYRGKQGKQRREYTHAFARKVTIPARPMVPEGALPSRWLRSLQEAFDDTMDVLLGHGK